MPKSCAYSTCDFTLNYGIFEHNEADTPKADASAGFRVSESAPV